MMVRLATAFFCSGFGALICQVVWQRMLGIFAGSDTVSAALVVGAFLMGLGIGSLIGAKLADRLPPARALLAFALCEAGAAGFALLSKPFSRFSTIGWPSNWWAWWTPRRRCSRCASPGWWCRRP